MSEKLRLYNEDFLMELADKGQEGREELEKKLAAEKTMPPEDRTLEEKKENIKRLMFALGGGEKDVRQDVLDDIEAGLADTSDMGGMN